MTNPYEPPHTNPRNLTPETGSSTDIPDRGLIGHIRILAILMMVQGALEALLGIGLAVLAAVMPSFMQGMPQQGGAPVAMNTMVVVLYGGMALVLGTVGGVRIFAGLRTYRLRSRNLAIVSISLGFLTIFGCYCLPTAIALFVYGLIVYLNQPVIQAFAQVERGESAAAILGQSNSSPV